MAGPGDATRSESNTGATAVNSTLPTHDASDTGSEIIPERRSSPGREVDPNSHQVVSGGEVPNAMATPRTQAVTALPTTDAILANAAKVAGSQAEALDHFDDTREGGMVTKFGAKVLDKAAEWWADMKREWNDGGWLGKGKALFVGLGAALMYFGGKGISLVGKAFDLVSKPFMGLASAAAPDHSADRRQAALNQDAADARKDLLLQLESIKQAEDRQQSRALLALAQRINDIRGGNPNPAELNQVEIILNAASTLGLHIPVQ